MPTSDQNVASLQWHLELLSDEELIKEAKHFAKLPKEKRERLEEPLVDKWAERDLTKLSTITDELPSLSLRGLERLKVHVEQLLLPIENELARRKGKKGPRHKPDVWIAALFYRELIGRGLSAEAKKFLKDFDVSQKTILRTLADPHRDEP